MANQSKKLRFSSLGFQMAITIGLGAWGGNYLDSKYQTEKPYYTIVCILVSIAIAMYQVIREVKNINRSNQKEEHPNEK